MLRLDPVGDGRRDHQRRCQAARNEFAEAVSRECGHPGTDGNREGGLHKSAASQRRVECVVAQPAPQQLADGDGEETGHCAHPQGEGRRQRQCQQDTGDGCAPVAQRTGLTGRTIDRAFSQQTGCSHDYNQSQRGQTILPDRESADRQQGQHHVQHDAIHAAVADDMRGRTKYYAHAVAFSRLNRESVVKRSAVCVARCAGQGATTRNGCSIPRRSNAAMRCGERAMRFVATPACAGRG